ncbi:MAG: hypothetical protein ACK4RZ_03520 [Paracoccaceae bacterium]
MVFCVALLVSICPTVVLAKLTSWQTFYGDPAATKFANVQNFIPDTVADLERVWAVPIGDVLDGSGDLPATVRSASPIDASSTLYPGKPFRPIVALDPSTVADRWSYAGQSALRPLTQPAFKTRDVAYWDSGQTGVCEKRVNPGKMDAELHAVDADTGPLCAGFADGGVRDLNQYNTVNAKVPFLILQPPTVVGDTLMVGWAGKDREYPLTPPVNLVAIAVPALVQTTKMGLIFGLNREAGASIFPIEDRAMPAVCKHENVDSVVFTAGGNSILKPQVSDQLVTCGLGAGQ